MQTHCWPVVFVAPNLKNYRKSLGGCLCSVRLLLQPLNQSSLFQKLLLLGSSCALSQFLQHQATKLLGKKKADYWHILLLLCFTESRQGGVPTLRIQFACRAVSDSGSLGVPDRRALKFEGKRKAPHYYLLVAAPFSEKCNRTPQSRSGDPFLTLSTGLLAAVQGEL